MQIAGKQFRFSGPLQTLASAHKAISSVPGEYLLPGVGVGAGLGVLAGSALSDESVPAGRTALEALGAGGMAALATYGARKLGRGAESVQKMARYENLLDRLTAPEKQQDLVMRQKEMIDNGINAARALTVASPALAIPAGALGAAMGGGLANVMNLPQTTPVNPNAYEGSNTDSNLMSYYAAMSAMQPPSNKMY